MKDREDSQDSLSTEDSMYKSFIEEALQGVMIFQSDPLNIVYANPAMSRLSGYSNAELLSFTFKQLQEITDPIYRDLIFGDVDEFLTGTLEPRQYTFQAIRKNGSTYWAELTAKVIQHHGQSAILLGFLDVSEIKTAEQKIAEERDRAQLYLDWAGVMFLALDPDGSIVLMNQKACDVLGCNVEDISGEDWFDMFIPDRVRKDSKKIFNSLMNGEVVSLRERENYVITSAGEEKRISWYTTVLRNKKDEIIGLLSSGVDVTERKRAEDALLESEQKYRTLIERLPVVTWTSDEDGNTIYISPNVEEIYGYTPLEIKEEGQDLWFGRIHPEDRERVRKEQEKAIEEKRGFDITYRIKRKDGKWIWIHDTATRFHDEEGITYSSGMFTDITEKKEIELALSDSEEKYRTLVENMDDGVAILLEGRISFANTSLCNIMGYPLEELVDKPFLSFVAPHDKDIVADYYRKRLAGEEVPNEYDLQAIRKDGSFPTLRISAETIEYQGTTATVVAITDITERKKIELALEESELKYRTLIESMIDGIAIHQAGKIIFTNEASANILGYSVKELEGINFIDLIAPEYRDTVIDIAQRRMAGKEVPHEYEVRGLHKDGRQPILNIRGEIIEYEGNPAVVAIVKDVTIQREAEETLRLVQYSIDNASDPVFWVDKDGKFAFTNEAANNYLGYSKEEIEELSVWEIYPEFSTERGPRLLAAIKEKGSDIVEISIKDKKGNLHPVEVNVSYLIFEGRELFFSYVRDISERKEAELALQNSANELRATKDRALLYLDIMGHDIRNKLQGMLLASQIALLGVEEEESREALGIQEKSIETIQSLITRVKSLEEMISEPLAQYDFLKVVSASIVNLKEQYPHAEIFPDIQIDKALIQADIFLETLIMNILDNAVDHNPNYSPKIWIHFTEDQKGYNLSIRDNGPGISNSRKEELMDPDRRYGGIALHQSKFIVEKYGGFIEIRDRIDGHPSEGARFCIWIPKSS